jgi:D-alanyl-D-alanine carboxypeptidase
MRRIGSGQRVTRRVSSVVAVTVALAVGLVFTGTGVASAPAKGPQLDAATKKRLEKIVADQFAKSGMPGVSVVVTIGAQRFETTLGVADLDTKSPYPADDNVRIASITKTFAATAVLQLVDKHKLSLDDKVEKFIPNIPNGDVITVRQLLGMQSGLFDFTSDPTFTAEFGADPNLPWQLEDTLAIVRANPVQFQPGTQTVYCDTNYVLLGAIIEEVTGRAVADVITKDVIEKAGLSDTVFPKPGEAGIPDPHPTGYLPDPDDPSVPLTRVGDVNPEVAWTAGNMTSTAADLEKWAKVLAGGSLLSKKTQRERLKSHPFANVPINLGYGLGVERINDLVGHNGAIVGFSTAMYYYPKADATFVVTGNASTNFTTPTTEIALLLVKELYPKQVR